MSTVGYSPNPRNCVILGEWYPFRAGGKLMEIDRFCHAEQKINQRNVTPLFRDEAVQAIQPGVQEVELGFENDRWQVYRREIYEDYPFLHSNGNLYGTVVDSSEQLVADASLRILRQQSNSVQNPDPGRTPIFLVRVDDDIDSCEELKRNRDLLFPVEPELF